MTDPATFPLPAEAAGDLRALFAEPRRVAEDVAPGALERVLDLARALGGAERVGVSLAGGPTAGELAPGADLGPGEVELDGVACRAVELAVPLLPGGEGPRRRFGVVALAPPPSAEAAARVARHVATQLVQDALDRARVRDPLTGLPARPSFDRTRPALAERLARGEPLTLALLDVDGLRRLNASAGPAAGDELLATLGAAARAAAEELGGRAYRYGADELLLALGASLAPARAAVEGLQAVARGAATTLSAGLASAPEHGAAPDELLLHADQALAAAKRRGPSQVQAWSRELESGPRWDRVGGVLTGRPERDAKNVEALLDSVAAVSQLAPLDATLTALVDRCVEVTGAERGLLLAREGTAWQLRVARGRGGRALGSAAVWAASVVEAAWAAGRVVHRVEGEGELSPSATALELRAILCAPLTGPDVPAGVVYVDSTEPSRFDAATQAFFDALVGQLTTALRNAQLYERLLDRARRLQHDLSGREEELTRVRRLLARGPGAGAETTYERILGRSPAMQEVFASLRSLEGVAVPVVIEGESGTGKELIARAIHARSPRKDGPWVAVNSAAIPGGLFESELFGYSQGAFTGAQADKAGLLEEAHGGTLFLDEVGELPLEAQAKLLRALQEGEVRRVGDAAPRAVDVRVIAATNRDLRAMVEEGSFREDLFYRLAVFRIRLPPLRERAGDLPLLAERLLEEAAARGVPRAELTPAALRTLTRRRWSGNVRELRNVLERAATLSRGEPIEPEHLGEETTRTEVPSRLYELPLKEAKALFALDYARRAIERQGGSVSAAARAAGVTRQTLYRAVSDGEELERGLLREDEGA